MFQESVIKKDSALTNVPFSQHVHNTGYSQVRDLITLNYCFVNLNFFFLF